MDSPDDPARVADCLFCRIVAGELPAGVVREAEHTLAIRDIAPQAPTHVLVVTRHHHRDVASLTAAAPALAAALLTDAAAVAEQEGLRPDGYRLVVNTGDRGGQTVPHVHVHVLGGRQMHWPPG